jgi:hypothetical protein
MGQHSMQSLDLLDFLSPLPCSVLSESRISAVEDPSC